MADDSGYRKMYNLQEEDWMYPGNPLSDGIESIYGNEAWHSPEQRAQGGVPGADLGGPDSDKVRRFMLRKLIANEFGMDLNDPMIDQIIDQSLAMQRSDNEKMAGQMFMQSRQNIFQDPYGNP